MSKIVFIGDIDFIKGFEIVGASVFDVDNKEKLISVLNKIIKEDYKIVYILEDLAKKGMDIIERYKDRFSSIVIIPDYRRELGVCNVRVKNAIVEAVGADIFTPHL